MPKTTEVIPRDLLLRLLDEAYEKRAWHGTNLRGALRGLLPNQAFWRPADERHNIWELVGHIAYWKYTVRRRLLGEKRGSFPRKGSNWFATPSPTDAAWREELALLDQQHRALRTTVAEVDASRLADKVNLVSGVACHDIYHTGQIQLLKRIYQAP